MTYLVKLTSRAERDLTSLYDQINAANSVLAERWYLGLKAAILELDEMPNRNAITPENKALRHLLNGRKPHIYRVIFRVKTKARVVEVLHIRHGARRKFRASELR